jgi:hypothetical protein
MKSLEGIKNFSKKQGDNFLREFKAKISLIV